MFHEQKATQVTPECDTDRAALAWLATRYAYPPTPRTNGFLRVNMVQSIDGAVSIDGVSGALGGPGDRTVFRTLRGLADVVIVGAGTAVTEGYGQPTQDSEFADPRSARGQRPAPLLALVSRSLSVPTDFAPVGHPDTVVLTCRDAPAERRRRLAEAGATLIDCGTERVDPHQIRSQLVARGLPRLLCEGGPTLLGALAAAGVIDELCLSTSPRLVGGDVGRIVHTSVPLPTARWRTEQILTDDDGYIFTRWRPDRDVTDAPD